MGKPYFADDGALAMIASGRVSYVPVPGLVYELYMPSDFGAHDATEIVALGRGVWLRQGDHFAYASLEHVSGTTEARVSLSWQVAELPEVLSDAESIAGDGGEALWISKSSGGLWLLTASSSGSEARGIRVETRPGKLFAASRPTPFEAKVTHHPNGCDVVVVPSTPSPTTRTRQLDAFDSSPEGSLCDAWVLNERGRLWLQSGNALIAERGAFWFLLRSAHASSRPAPLTLYESPGPSWRAWFRTHGPGDLVGRRGLPVVGALMLGAALTGGSFVSREHEHSHGFVRTLSASVLAQPMVGAFGAGASISTAGRAGTAIQNALIGVGVLLSPLPALGAWAGGRMTNDHAAAPGRGFAAAYGGAALGAVISTPLSAWVLEDHGGAAGWWFAQLASSALIGFGASLGYALAADLPSAPR